MEGFQYCHLCPDKIPVGGLEEHLETHRNNKNEQRRYEIARDVMAAWVRYSGFGDAKHNAKMAVYCADALLKELEKT